MVSSFGLSIVICSGAAVFLVVMMRTKMKARIDWESVFRVH